MDLNPVSISKWLMAVDHNQSESILVGTKILYDLIWTSLSKPLSGLYNALIAKHLSGYR